MIKSLNASVAQARAWEKVWDTLHDVYPNLMNLPGSGEQMACQAIRNLAKAADPWMPEFQAWCKKFNMSEDAYNLAAFKAAKGVTK